jgi:hypothetical protein
MLKRLLIVVSTSIFIIGCNAQFAPKCESDDAKNIVLQLIPDVLSKKVANEYRTASFRQRPDESIILALTGDDSNTQLRVKLNFLLDGVSEEVAARKFVNKLTYRLEAVRTTGINKEIGSYQCTAAILVANAEKKKEVKYPVSYKTELSDGGKNYVVSLY